MPPVRDVLNLTTTLRFIAPPYNKSQWQKMVSELKEVISPLHFGLANNITSPQEAGKQFSGLLYDFLQSKPEFVSEIGEKEVYSKNEPNILQKAKQPKKDLRKRIQQKDATPEDKRLFGQSVRYHNHVLNEQQRKYEKIFWEFSKKLDLDEPANEPTFNKATADDYYLL
jgi:hypothetical protein